MRSGQGSAGERIAHEQIRLGYQPIALGETEIKRAFGIPTAGKCVDIVATNRRGACVVAECKGAVSRETS